MTKEPKSISQLLSELQEQGATVKQAKEGKAGGTALTDETLKSVAVAGAPFDAWVSWSKSF